MREIPEFSRRGPGGQLCKKKQNLERILSSFGGRTRGGSFGASIKKRGGKGVSFIEKGSRSSWAGGLFRFWRGLQRGVIPALEKGRNSGGFIGVSRNFEKKEHTLWKKKRGRYAKRSSKRKAFYGDSCRGGGREWKREGGFNMK